MRRLTLFGSMGLVALVWLSSPAGAEEPPRDPSIAGGTGPIVTDEPAFPDSFLHDRVRLWVNTTVAPSTDFGGPDLAVVRPELRLRARVPIGHTLSAQVTGEFHANHYDKDGHGVLFEDCADCNSPDDFYAASLGVQGGYLLNRSWSLFRDDEHWALLGALTTSARWEPGAFQESITPGGVIELGYQLPDQLRLSIGAQVGRALDGDGVDVTPTGYLSWQFAPKFELKSRGLGLELDYRPWTYWELFLAGFSTSDRFRLDHRTGAPSGMTFRDRQVSVGGGVVWKVFHELRIAAEVGAIVDRQLSVDDRDDGRLDSVDGDASAYISLRVELRP